MFHKHYLVRLCALSFFLLNHNLIELFVLYIKLLVNGLVFMRKCFHDLPLYYVRILFEIGKKQRLDVISRFVECIFQLIERTVLRAFVYRAIVSVVYGEEAIGQNFKIRGNRFFVLQKLIDVFLVQKYQWPDRHWDSRILTYHFGCVFPFLIEADLKFLHQLVVSVPNNAVKHGLEHLIECWRVLEWQGNPLMLFLGLRGYWLQNKGPFVLFWFPDQVHSKIQQNWIPRMDCHDSFLGLKVVISLLPIRKSKYQNEHLALSLMVLEFIVSSELTQ